MIVAGVVLIVIGCLVWTGAFKWFGSLPGDIKVERESFRFYLPIVSMLLISVVLTVLLRIARRFF